MLIDLSENHDISEKIVSLPNKIHPTALIAEGARLGSNVTVGPFSMIGEYVSIDNDTVIGAHVVIEGWTTIGKKNQIYTGAVIGSIPQDLKFNGEKSTVTIGDNNIIREYVTINRGTLGGGSATKLGDHNLLMTGCHVAHDVHMGSHNVIANGVAIGGHVVVEDWVTIGGLVGIHQFCKIGKMSMIGGHTAIRQHVLPFSLVEGLPPKVYGVNLVRLRRNGYSVEARMLLQKAYKIINRQGITVPEISLEIRQKLPATDDIEYILNFLANTERGIYR
ncbi:MAG: acyl-ACP--UDP-N-acetylglucosamine O-acyltransferase [Legionellaceae bacterium]|nr:acyl-ACP--UDP-N-acetylglucosamine O-acyltransferase [Legionellaceae bacterium]